MGERERGREWVRERGREDRREWVREREGERERVGERERGREREWVREREGERERMYMYMHVLINYMYNVHVPCTISGLLLGSAIFPMGRAEVFEANTQ